MRSIVIFLLGCALSSSLSIAAQDSLSMPDQAVDNQARPDGFATLSRRLMPAVVNITTSRLVANALPQFNEGPLQDYNDFFGRNPDGFSQEGSLGSGFVIAPEGLIVTNHHVIDGADEINAVFSDGVVRRADLIGADEATDIAVLKVSHTDPLPFVDWADSETAQVGDWVMAIGNPFGFGGSVSVGIVSARNRDIQSGNYDNYIQTDAAINSGNSGGPLFNMRGEVLGVNTAIITPTGGSVGLGFSIPANLASQISAQLIEFGRARRGWFGVNIQAADLSLARAYGLDDGTGVILTRIAEDGPAARADFEIGDLILTFDGQTVTDERALSRIVAETEIGKQVEVSLVRQGERKSVVFELGELENLSEARDEGATAELSQMSDGPFGIDFIELTDAERRGPRIPSDIEGVLIQLVSPQGPAFGKLRRGDVIMEIGSTAIKDVGAASQALARAAETPQIPLLLRIYRNGQTFFEAIDLQDSE